MQIMDGIPEIIGVLGAQMFAMHMTISSNFPKNLAFTIAWVIAGSTVCLIVTRVSLLMHANLTCLQ